MAIGVFGLQVAYRLKRLEVMSTTNTHGWFGGGVTPTSSPVQVSRVDRIDFSNDTGTANIRGSLILAKTSLAATGNSNYGWFGGGRAPSASPATVTRVERIDFSNDSTTASPRGPLTRDRYELSALGNSNYGWFGGGYTLTLPFFGLSTIDRIDFSNDATTASSRGLLNTNANGRQLLAATGNSNYGWFGGGVHNPSPTPVIVSTVDRIDFSNDSASVLGRGSLSLVKGSLTATGNSNYGWFGGGYGPASAYYSTVERIDFANDSTSLSIRGPLSAARYASSATSGQAKGPAIKLQKAGNYGWFGGGVFVNSISPTIIKTFLATVDRIDFSNDLNTASPRTGALSAARGYLAATGNSNYGWFSGGTSFVPTVDRIDYSNDAIAASVRGPLITGRAVHAGTANSNYGWFGGGGNPSRLSTVNRINFSNDSSTSSVRGLLSDGRFGLAATGNSNYGWFGGGNNGSGYVPTVDRIDFSNDSSSASPRGPLSSARGYLSATGNSNYGWFGGGFTGSHTSIVDRIDFSNDLNASASVRSPLDAVISHTGATGNSNYGWWTGGASGGLARVNVVRINFANDATTISTRGPLSSARYRHGATSNSTR